MNFWNELTSLAQLENIKKESEKKPVFIFKHSTRCSISKMVLDRIDRNWKAENGNTVTPYYLDLLTHREISNSIADSFAVEHESPQILLIENYQCTFFESQHAIRLEDVLKVITAKN